MKKITVGAMLLVCGLVSCSSCSGPKQPPAIPDGTTDAGSGAVTVTNGNWSLIFPNANWQVDAANALNELREAGDIGTMTPYVNEVDKNLIVVITQTFAGSTQQMALLAVRGLADSGTKILSSKLIKINGMDMVYVDAFKPEEGAIWIWLGVKNGTGYSIACGGLEESNPNQFLLCDQIVSTFKIK